MPDRDRTLFDQSQAIQLLIDPGNGNIVDANQAACRFFGYSLEQLSGMPVAQINEITPEAIAAEMERARSLKLNHFRFRHRLASGEKRDVEIYSGPVEVDGRTFLLSTIVDVTEVMAAQQALAESAEKLRVLMGTSTDGVLLMANDGRLLEVNARYSEMTGYSIDELTGMYVGDVDARETTEQVVGRLGRYRESDYQRFERQHRAKDGHLVDLEVSLAYVRASECFIVFARDITDRKADERRLAELHELNEKMIAGLPVGVLAYRADGQCVLANSGAEALIGAPADKLLEQNFRQIDSWKKSGLTAQSIGTLETGTPRTRELHITTTFGLERYLQATTVAFTSQDEPHLLVLFLDTTEQRKAEHALQESLELFRNAMEYAVNGMALVTPDGNWVRVNQALCSLLGYTEAELLASNLSSILRSADVATVAANMQDLLSGKTEAIREERPLVRRDGSEVPAFAAISLVRDDTGTPIYMVSQIQDVSEVKRTEGRLRRSNEELEQFAYVVSHDLRAPLRAIRNLVGWITEDLGDAEALPPEVAKNVALLLQRTDRLDALIEGILQYSRIGRDEHSVTQIDPARLIEDTWSLLSPPSSVALQVRCEVPTVLAAEVPLSMVLRNLLDNALKHSHTPYASISVTVSEDERAYQFDVADDGPGIAPEHRDRIFRIFETLQPKDATGTVGVGLALVRKTIAQAGGSIEVLDNPKGRGALFRVRWPKATATAQGLR